MARGAVRRSLARAGCQRDPVGIARELPAGMTRKSKHRSRAKATPPPLPALKQQAGQMTIEHGLSVTASPVSTIELSVDDIIEALPDAAHAVIDRDPDHDLARP
jgi:hypothetical protein